MGDDAHEAVALGEAGEDPDGLLKALVVQRAEAFIEEEGVQPDAARRALDLVREAQSQRQGGFEALAAREGLDAAAGAVVVVDDAEVEAGLAALVLGTHPLQLVLPGGHLHEAGVGVDEDGVEVVHLDVSLKAYLLFAAEGAARRRGEGVHPLPAAFQLRPGGGVLTVEVSGLPVGQEAGRQGLFLSRESGAPGRQGVPLGFEGGQVGGFARLCLLGRQGRDCGLGSGAVLPGLGQSRRGGVHPGPEGAALVFQPGQRPAGFFPACGGQSGPGLGTLGLQRLGGGGLPGGFLGGSPCLGLEGRALGGLFLPLVLLPGLGGEGGGILLLSLVKGFLCGVQGLAFFGQSRLQKRDSQLHRPLRRGEPLRQQGLGVPAEGGFGLPVCGHGLGGGRTGFLCGAVGLVGGLSGRVHPGLRGGFSGQKGPPRVMGAAADGAGGAVRQTLGQQARLRVEKGPLEVVAEGVGALLCAVGEKIALLGLPCGLPPALPLGEALGQLREGRFPPGQLFGPGLKAHLLGLRAPKGGEALLQSGQLSVQLPEGGAALFGSGVLEGGGVPGGRKLLFEAVQPVEGREVGFRPLELSGQRVQRGGIPGVAGRFGLGGVQNGPQSVLTGLRGGQLEAELLGLFGPAQRLLKLVQLCLGLSPGGGGGAQRLLLPGQQGVQKGQRRFWRRLPARLAEGGQLVQNGLVGVPLGPA